MVQAGLPVRQVEEGKNVPMYRTTVLCVSAGCFAGPLVVSMGPFSLAQRWVVRYEVFGSFLVLSDRKD